MRIDDHRPLDARDTRHPATGAQSETFERAPLGGAHRREVLLALQDAHGIRAAHPHAAAVLDRDLARLGDVEQLVAGLRHYRRAVPEGDRDLAGVNGFGNAQQLVAGV